MPLLSFFASNPQEVAQLTIEQVVASAGDGFLKDQSVCSYELRSYLNQIPTTAIAKYIDRCLENSFTKSGMVLQDLINELGRRLDYEVENGRYQGISSAIGFDGLWSSPEAHSVVLEVKTTDAYRLSLETLAQYRRKLDSAGQLAQTSSILIVVGRQDTGELEAQIRGSRHAWDVRVISAEALIKLVKIKENSEAPETDLKIRSLLTPVEYTRLDKMVDVMFTAVSDVDEQVANDELSNGTISDTTQYATKIQSEEAIGKKYSPELTDSKLLQEKREKIISAIALSEGTALIRKSRAVYWNAARNVRAVWSISKKYLGKNQNPYWYAYHPAWDDFLAPAEQGFFILGCMDREEAYAIPRQEMEVVLPYLHTTTAKDGKAYWHIHLKEGHGGLEMVIPNTAENLKLQKFVIPTVT